MTGCATTPGSAFVSGEENGRAKNRSSKSTGTVSPTKDEDVRIQEQGFAHT